MGVVLRLNYARLLKLHLRQKVSGTAYQVTVSVPGATVVRGDRYRQWLRTAWSSTPKLQVCVASEHPPMYLRRVTCGGEESTNFRSERAIGC